GARRLILMGERAPAAREADAALRELQRRGAEVTVRDGDVSDAAQVAQVVTAIDREGRPLRGVVHAAGVLDERVLLQQDPAGFASVLAPKAEGAWQLHRLTR